VLRFLVIAAQLAVLIVLFNVFQIEPSSGLLRVLPLVFAGFLVHAFLPLRYRQQFFLLLSVAAFAVVLGPRAALLLVVLGLALIGICHLPVAFSTRVVLLVWAGAVLAALRAGWAPALLGSMPPVLSLGSLPKLVLPVLGSMFMFRAIIYLYELRHEERERQSARAKSEAGIKAPMGAKAGVRGGAPATIWARLSYFFLLPNVCFLLFPIVDYRTYRRTYYDTDERAIYQKGVWWICLGLIYLLCYRVVYQYLVPAPEDVQGLSGVVRFLTSSYLIYVRVVGQFHLITGLLCLFGFNLPPAHRFYLLASGFTDFWRRARIDWKDFMVKVFYYPVLVPLQRKWGTMSALVVGTISVFVATWLLHAYQWFWLRGDFRLSQADAVFWTIIGGCVLANSVLEARPGRKRATAATAAGEWRASAAVVHALKVMGMFVFMCVLWSYWSSPSLSAWWSLVKAAGESGSLAYAILGGALGAVLGAGVLVQFIMARLSKKSATSAARTAPPARVAALRRGALLPAWAEPAGVAVAAAILLIGVPATHGVFGGPAAVVAATLRSNRLNDVDQERHDRGYYETLLDEPRSTASILNTDNPPERAAPQGALERAAEDTHAKENTGPLMEADFVRQTGDFLDYELLPSYQGSFHFERFETNRWGMRDKNYEIAAGSGTYRIALIGASIEMGAGVANGEVFESLVEARLNHSALPGRRFEILNFAIGNYSVLQNVALFEQKVSTFHPDAIFFTIHSKESRSTISFLTRLVRNGTPVPYPYVQQTLLKASVRSEMHDGEFEQRLQPFADDLIRWSYHRIAELCRQRKITPIAFVVPRTFESEAELAELRRYSSWARQAGFTVLSLEGAYGSQPQSAVSVSETNRHPNALGHRLLADRLFDLLHESDGKTLKLGLRTDVSAPAIAESPPNPLNSQTLATAEHPPTTLAAPSAQPSGARPLPWPLETQDFIRKTGDLLGYELIPSYNGAYKGASFRTNRWGLRDKEYLLKPAAGIYRIALVGSSFSMGAGVPVEETHEALLEDRLNREGPGVPRRHYEILNFSVGGYGILQNVVVTERKVFPFAPKAILLIIQSVEIGRMSNHLTSLIQSRIPIPYPYVREKLQRAGVAPDMDDYELRRRLRPIVGDLVGWSYGEIVRLAREHGVPVVGIVLPTPREGPEPNLALVIELAAKEGIPLLSLNGVYDGHALDSVRLSSSDDHLNALGHRLVADRLYQLLRDNDAKVLNLGFSARR
jgi:hypothetical protein